MGGTTIPKVTARPGVRRGSALVAANAILRSPRPDYTLAWRMMLLVVRTR
jgi:hypothetical protein